MTLIGTRSDWSFISSSGYNELDILADNKYTRPGSTGVASCFVPISSLLYGDSVEAVLTGKPSLSSTDLTATFWIRPEEVSSLNHATLLGIRVDPSLSYGFRSFYIHNESSISSLGIETLSDNIIKAKNYFKVNDPSEWVKVRLSTSNINGSPSVLMEVLDTSGAWRKKAYVADNLSSMLLTDIGTISWGVRNNYSSPTNGSRFDDIELYSVGLNIQTPLPFYESFEETSWNSSYLGSNYPEEVTASIKIDSNPDSSGTRSIEFKNTDSSNEKDVFISVAISDGTDVKGEAWLKFIDSDAPVELSLRTRESTSTNSLSGYVLQIRPADNELKLIRRSFSGDVEIDSYIVPVDTPPDPCTPAVNPLGDKKTWYGFRLSVIDEVADPYYIVEFNKGDSSGWDIVMEAEDTGSDLFAEEGFLFMQIGISPSGSVMVDDITYDKV